MGSKIHEKKFSYFIERFNALGNNNLHNFLPNFE